MRTQIFRLFKNAAVLLIILYVADRGLGLIITHYLFTEKQGDSFVTRRTVTEMKEDIVIVGSSRAQHHYIPDLITKETGLSCYNIGRDGMKMLYYEAMFEAMLSYHKPKIIILDLNFSDFENDEGEKVVLTSAVLPFLKQNKVLNGHIYNLDRLEYYKAKFSVLYRLNSFPLPVLQHHLGIGNKTYNGYKPLYGSDLKVAKVTLWDNKDYKESVVRLIAFENIVRMAKDMNIKLFVVVSPALQMPRYNALSSAEKVLKRYHVKKIFNYAELFNIGKKGMFHDPGHLNNLGAEYFTKKIITDFLLEATL